MSRVWICAWSEAGPSRASPRAGGRDAAWPSPLTFCAEPGGPGVQAVLSLGPWVERVPWVLSAGL